MDWITVFDGESYTAEEVVAKLGTMKLANLSEGEYVAKDKLDRALERAKTAESELTASKAQLDGDEGLKQQVALLTAQLSAASAEAEGAKSTLTRRERTDAALKHTKDAKLAKLLVIEAEALVDDSTDFDEAMAKVIESDPTYVKEDAPPTTTVTTGKETSGTSPSTPEAAAIASFALGANITE